MKKILNLFLMAITIFALASCVDSSSTTTSFEITSYPKTTYILNEKFSWEGLEIKVDSTTYKYGDVSSTIEEQISNWTSINDPSTTTAGTFTVKLTCKNGLSASFQYTVVDKQFANGDGTAASPYQISTVEQFYIALKNDTSTKTYYTIVNDIDFDKKLKDRTAESCVTKNVEINGQGYALRNVNGVLGYVLEDSTIKNVNFYFATAGGETFIYRKRGAIFEYLHGEVTFENINTFGKIDFKTSNASIFGQIEVDAAYDKNIAVLKNCNNYASFTNLGTYGAVFTGGTAYTGQSKKTYKNDHKNSVWYVLNCKNYGEYIAAHVGLINPNANYLIPSESCFAAYYVVDENTKNFGQLISLGDKEENIYRATVNDSAAGLSSLLCAYNFPTIDMNTVFSHYYMFDSAKGVIAGNEFIGKNVLSQFTADNYKTMAAVDIKDMSTLTYNFAINLSKAEADADIVFALTKGEGKTDDIAYYVISLTGASTKHSEDGTPGLNSANSTFATIKVDGSNISTANSLLKAFGKVTKNSSTGNNYTWTASIENYLGSLGWSPILLKKDGKKYIETYTVSTEQGTLVSGSWDIATYDNKYIVIPNSDNGYATASGISIISIVAYGTDGNVCGGIAVETDSMEVAASTEE